MPETESVKVTAIPRSVDSVNHTVSLSVLLSPELSGGDNTIAGTSFENWPATLAALAAGSSTYSPAYWEASFLINGGTTKVTTPLDAGSTSADFWGSLFHSSTPHAPADPVAEQVRSAPIASFPAKQVSDFVRGQFDQYSPTKVPDFETVKKVYAPIMDGLIGVAGQETQARLAQERRTGSRANDFTNATDGEAAAAHEHYLQAGAGPQPTGGTSPIDFHAALTYIGQHGTLQRTLGLVFDLTFAYQYYGLLGQVFNGNGTFLGTVSVALLADPKNGSAPVTRKPQIVSGGPFRFTQLDTNTRCVASSDEFLAKSGNGEVIDGLLDVSEKKYAAVSNDLSGDISRAIAFAHNIDLAEHPKAHTPTDAHTPGKLPGEMPPPSLRSGGLTLTEVNRAENFAAQIDRAQTLSDAADAAFVAGDGSDVPDFTAEDLVRGYALDVLAITDTYNQLGTWYSTAERNISYTSGSTTVNAPTSAPFDEAATQAPPRLQKSPDDEDEDQINLSERILSYTGWSNAVARPGKPLDDQDSNLGPGTAPFPIQITEAALGGRLPTLRFGQQYALRARIIDVANGKVELHDAPADERHTPMSYYRRHEPLPSPDLFPQSIPGLGASLKQLVVRDSDPDAPTAIVLYPHRVSQPFAEAHGLFDHNGAPDPAAYAAFVPRESARYPDPPAPPDDATTLPPAIARDQPVPFLPDPLVRGGTLLVSRFGADDQYVSFDFAPASGQSWPDYRPFGLELVRGSAFAVDVDASRRVVTFTLTPADVIGLRLSATCDPGDAPLLELGYSQDPAAVAAGLCWAVTPYVALQLSYAVQKPLATPELTLQAGRDSGATSTTLSGKLAWSPKSTSEVDVVASWGDPVDDPTTGALQGPGTPTPALRVTPNSPAATLRLGGSQAPSATTDVTFTHELFDTKHRQVTYTGVATGAFAECYPEDTPLTVSSQKPVTVNVPSSARPEAPVITGVVPIYGWSQSASGGKVVSTRSPSALRVFLARPWWSSGIDELLGVITSPVAFTKFTVSPEALPYITQWGADPVFGGAALPSQYPRPAAFPAAIAQKQGLAYQESVGYGADVSGHAVAFDASRNTWYCDIEVDTGGAYTPMIKLALARYQPNSVNDRELSKVVTTQIFTLEPGRAVTVVRSGSKVSSVTLTGPSYTKAAQSGGAAPGFAEVQVEKRVKEIDDDALGWERDGGAKTMYPGRSTGSGATWRAQDLSLHGAGPHRLIVTQYEVLPTDVRVKGQPDTAHRLVHQDVIPL